MSQVLLTGATGLVGGHLLRLLQNEPYKHHRRADASPAGASGRCL